MVKRYKQVFQTNQDDFNAVFDDFYVYTNKPKKKTDEDIAVYDFIVNGVWVLFQLQSGYAENELTFTAPSWFSGDYISSLSQSKSFRRTQYNPVNLVVLEYQSDRQSFSVKYIGDPISKDISMMCCVLQYDDSSYRFSILYNSEKCDPPLKTDTMEKYKKLWKKYGARSNPNMRQRQEIMIEYILSKKVKQAKKISFTSSQKRDHLVPDQKQKHIKDLKPGTAVHFLQQVQDILNPRRKNTLDFFIHRYFQETSPSQRSFQDLNTYLENNNVTPIEAYGLYYNTLIKYFTQQKKKKQQQKKKKDDEHNKEKQKKLQEQKKKRQEQQKKKPRQQTTHSESDLRNLFQQKPFIFRQQHQQQYSVNSQSFTDWARSLSSHILTTNAMNVYKYICNVLRLDDLSQWNVNTPPQNMLSLWNCVLATRGRSIKELSDGSCEEFRYEATEALINYIKSHGSFQTTTMCFHKDMTEEEVYILLEKCLRRKTVIPFTFNKQVHKIHGKNISQMRKTFHDYIKSKRKFCIDAELSIENEGEAQLYTWTQITQDIHHLHDLLKILPYEPFSIEYVCFDLEKCTRDPRSSCISSSWHHSSNNETIVLLKVKNTYSYLSAPESSLIHSFGIHFTDPDFFQY